MMLQKTGLGIALVLSVLGATNLPALAQTSSRSFTVERRETRSRTMAQNTTVAAMVGKDVIFEVGQRHPQPIPLFLTHPLLDSAGNVIVPANAPIKASLVPARDGAKIEMAYVSVAGQRLPLNLSSDLIPGRTVREIQALAKAGRLGGFSRDLGMLLSNTIGLKPQTGDRIVSGLTIFGTLVGALSPEQRKVVAIPKGEVVILD